MPHGPPDPITWNEERLLAILDNTTAVVYVKDPDGRYLLVNRCFENLFHVTRAGIAGKTDFDIFPPDLAEAFRANDRRVFETRGEIEFEEVAQHDDGRHTYISLKFPLFAVSGAVQAVCGISTDISERKEAQRKIEAMNAELEARVAERTQELQTAYQALEKAHKSLSELDRLKSAFIDLTSHELTTPLTVMSGMLAILDRKLPKGTGDLRTALEAAQRASKRLEKLVLRALEIARRNEYPKRLQKLPTAPHEVVRRAADRVRPFVEVRQQHLSAEAPENLPELEIDRGKIHDALVNLLTNAVKFTPDGGRIEVSARVLDGERKEVEFRVTDNGVGVSEEDKPHLFQEFFASLDTMHHSSGEIDFEKKGIGLGLAIVKMFAEMHGGRVGFESQRGKGSSFWFAIPAAAPK